jgi:hypothetical protein
MGETGYARGVAADTVDHLGGQRVEKVQAYEVKPGRISDYASLMAWYVPFVEDREIDPREAGLIARTPDDVLHI